MRVRPGARGAVGIGLAAASLVRVKTLTTVFPTLDAARWCRVAVTRLREHGARWQRWRADVGEVLGVECGRR